jgi:hypothetical protein
MLAAVGPESLRPATRLLQDLGTGQRALNGGGGKCDCFLDHHFLLPARPRRRDRRRRSWRSLRDSLIDAVCAALGQYSWQGSCGPTSFAVPSGDAKVIGAAFLPCTQFLAGA